MSFLKNVLHDLVEKRLWPVAIALVAALVAVPIVLGGSSSSADAPATDVAAVTAPNGLANHRDVARAQVVSLEEQAAGKVAALRQGPRPVRPAPPAQAGQVAVVDDHDHHAGHRRRRAARRASTRCDG